MSIVRLSDMVPGHKMCCICFEYTAFEDLYVDSEGQKWDLCKGMCAFQAGEGPLRLLVTGSRLWSSRPIMESVLKRLTRQGPVTLVHGGARGADQMAGEIGLEFGFTIEEHPANWRKYGKAAGFIRNQDMVDRGADYCYAFYSGPSRGTRDCVARAKEAGIPVTEVSDVK